MQVLAGWLTTGTSLRRSSLENVANKFVLASLAMPRASCSSNLDSLCDRKEWLLPGFVKTARNILELFPCGLFSVSFD